jgi:hypothetical protein
LSSAQVALSSACGMPPAISIRSRQRAAWRRAVGLATRRSAFQAANSNLTRHRRAGGLVIQALGGAGGEIAERLAELVGVASYRYMAVPPTRITNWQARSPCRSGRALGSPAAAGSWLPGSVR